MTPLADRRERLRFDIMNVQARIEVSIGYGDDGASWLLAELARLGLAKPHGPDGVEMYGIKAKASDIGAEALLLAWSAAADMFVQSLTAQIEINPVNGVKPHVMEHWNV